MGDPREAPCVVLAAVPADTDTLPLLPRGNTGAHFIYNARHFVSGDAVILNPGPDSVFSEYVAVADPTSLHLDAHLSGARLRNLALNDLKICRDWKLVPPSSFLPRLLSLP